MPVLSRLLLLVLLSPILGCSSELGLNSSLQIQLKDFEYKAEMAINTVNESVYADLPRGAITAAFWLWFGVLSFIISVTGTMLAFASLVLLDPRLHVIRNKKTAYWKGVSIRLSKFFVLFIQ